MMGTGPRSTGILQGRRQSTRAVSTPWMHSCTHPFAPRVGEDLHCQGATFEHFAAMCRRYVACLIIILRAIFRSSLHRRQTGSWCSMVAHATGFTLARSTPCGAPTRSNPRSEARSEKSRRFTASEVVSCYHVTPTSARGNHSHAMESLSDYG